MKAPKSSPWGRPDYVKPVAEGIMWVSTPSHGGFKLDRKRNAGVHPAWRMPGGWYEEDVEWAIVAYTFPHLFKENERQQALQLLADYFPHQYMEVTGLVLHPEESYKLEEERFRQAHATDFVAVAAFGDWHDRVPKGMVGVLARPGALRTSSISERWFLIPKKEYESRSPFGFVVDPERHKEIAPLQ